MKAKECSHQSKATILNCDNFKEFAINELTLAISRCQGQRMFNFNSLPIAINLQLSDTSTTQNAWDQDRIYTT